MSLKDCTSSRDTNNTGARVKSLKRRSSTDRSLTAEINKSFVAKRKCLESFTGSSLKTSQQKIEALWRSHQRERAQVCEDYSTRFSSVFQQWESDMQRNKDQDKKLRSLFQRQQMMFQHMRASQTKRLKMLKIIDHYIKSTQALQDAHEEQNIVAMSEFRQEMALLQKKILMNTQQEEMVSVRNALQSMLM